jgi:hypothetical protein
VAIGGTNYGTLRQRQGTVASLAAANPVLSYGEFTMTYDGLDPVLKIGDGTRPWLELPNLVGSGGGGGGGTVTYRAAESWSSAALRVAGEGGIDEFGSTWGAPYDPDGAHDPSSWIEDNGTGGLLLAEGWYHVALSVNIVFPAATAVDYVRVGLNVGSSLAGNHQVVLAPASATDDRVTFSDLVNLGPIYSDGTTTVRPSIRWTDGFYAPDDAELGAHIIRVEPVAGGGAGALTVRGKATYVASGYSYTENASAAAGTDIFPTGWTFYAGGSSGPEGPLDTSEYPGVTPTGGQIVIDEPGWWMVSLNWHIGFPSSTPTVFQPVIHAPWADPDVPNQYFPVVNRAFSAEFNQNTAGKPASRGTIHTALFWADAGDVVTLAGWYNTLDSAPQGASAASIPTMQAMFTRLA